MVISKKQRFRALFFYLDKLKKFYRNRKSMGTDMETFGSLGSFDLVQFISVQSLLKSKIFNIDITLDYSFIQIFKYLKEYHHANTIIVEHNYIDKDFTNEFSNLYSKTFRFRSGYCDRLHFFRDKFNDRDDFINKFHKDQFVYLGFLVKRPLEIGKVGRTIILPKKIEDFFYLCTIKRNIHFLGKTIEVTGTPFIEQDGMVITCAQASMWMAAKYMHHKHGQTRQFPFEITDKSTTFPYIGRSIPSAGLTHEQIVLGLHNMGYFPLFYYKEAFQIEDKPLTHKQSLWNPIDIIYPYIESEIPVLISFEGHVRHVCMAIGHKICRNIDTLREEEIFKDLEKKQQEIKKLPSFFYPAILPSSVFSDALIIHDDQRGIYNLLPLNQLYFNSLFKKHSDFLPKEEEDETGKKSFRYKDVNNIEAVIIPLPDKIYFLAEDAFYTSIKLFWKTLPILEKQAYKNRFAKELFSSSSIAEKNPIIFRVYFLRSVDFKKKIKLNEQINESVKNLYLSMNMPRFIWIVEISTYKLFLDSKCIIGEFIFDSTSNKYDHKNSYLSLHLPGLFLKNRGITSKEIFLENIPIEMPYKITYRDDPLECKINIDD